MKNTPPNPYGKEVTGLYNAKRVNTLIIKYKTNKIDFVLFKIHRAFADPKKAVIAQFIADGAGAVQDAKPIGQVFDKPLAKIKISQALDLFGDNSDKILDTINNLNKEYSVDQIVKDLNLA